MVTKNSGLSIKAQCRMLALGRSKIYYKSRQPTEQERALKQTIGTEHARHPFYGYRKIHVFLLKNGHSHNIKKTRRLMKLMCLQAIIPKKKTSIRNTKEYVYPYLLKNLTIDKPNQVWCTDITYVKLASGFCYVMAIIDVFSRKIVGFKVSAFMDTKLCIDALKEALNLGKPEIINSDQGSQYTSYIWTEELKKNNIAISMDGKGRWVDNVIVERLWKSFKYEFILLGYFKDIRDLEMRLTEYISFYNNERPHQSLDYEVPDSLYYSLKNHGKDISKVFSYEFPNLKGVPM